MVAQGVPRELAPGPAEPAPVSVLVALRFATEGRALRAALLPGVLLSLVPLVGWFAWRGYVLEIARRLARHAPDPVPEVSLGDLGTLARLGARTWALEYLALVTAALGGALSWTVLLGGTVGALLVAKPAAVTAIVCVAAVVGCGLGVLALSLTESAVTALELSADEHGILGYARRVSWRLSAATLRLAPLALVLLLAGFALCGLGVLPALRVLELARMHLRYQIFAQERRRRETLRELQEPSVLPSERAHAELSPPTTMRSASNVSGSGPR